MAYKIVFTAEEYINELKRIALELLTTYRNKFPYNLLYRLSPQLYSADCWNLIKSVLWGFDENEAVGTYTHANTSIGLGDWNGWTILQCCSEISTDFSVKTAGEYLLTKDKGHAGTYVGDFSWKGYYYNVIECTPSLNGGGVVPSYVDEAGRRYDRKGGRVQAAGWYWHGKLPWVDYKNEAKDVLAVDGSWGMATTRYTQKALHTEVDGEVSNQPWANKKYLPAAETTSWKFKLLGYRGGSDMVRALQSLIGAEVDGYFGRESVKALQKFLKNYYAKGEDSTVDGYMGKDTVKAWQRYINTRFKIEQAVKAVQAEVSSRLP